MGVTLSIPGVTGHGACPAHTGYVPQSRTVHNTYILTYYDKLSYYHTSSMKVFTYFVHTQILVFSLRMHLHFTACGEVVEYDKHKGCTKKSVPFSKFEI